ncbi:hypothetical protein [Stutzerimonas urumqiensis]|uniref:hypothetical protein n=1 Tax=Stutzerimonas urumqiensis TaxID=638269 RepID=UPI000EB4627D|nr:hypothetical protein [Stutzerimonas urumqiensis]
MPRYLGALIDFTLDLCDEVIEMLPERRKQPVREVTQTLATAPYLDPTESRTLDEILLVALEELNARAPEMAPADVEMQRAHLVAALAGDREQRLIAAQVLKELHVEAGGTVQ